MTELRLCAYPDCGRPLLSKGYCQGHYLQLGKGEELREIRRAGGWAPVEPCVFEGCDRARVTRTGLCGPHRRQELRGGPLKPLRKELQPCSFEGCERPSKSHGLCDGHRQQQARGGELRPLHVPKYRYVHTGGYILLKEPGHFAAQANGRLLEHVKVMAEHLGRRLLPEENVHHINGDRADNRLENLELWNTHQPKGQRVDDKVAWAIEILRLYRPDMLTTKESA